MDLNGVRSADVTHQSELFKGKYGTTITRQDMSNYLNSKSLPKTNKLLLLCDLLHVEPEYFTLEDDYQIPYSDFTVEERRLVRGWRKMDNQEKDIIRYILIRNNITLDNSAEKA